MKPAVLRAVERVRNGEPALTAARAEGVDHSYVGRVCKRLGVPTHKTGRPLRDAAAVERAVRRVLAGESVLASSTAEGAHYKTVAAHVRRRRTPPLPRPVVSAEAIIDAAVNRTRAVDLAASLRRHNTPAPHCALPSCPRPSVRGDYCARCAPLMENAP